jgi:hypothetical protein
VGSATAAIMLANTNPLITVTQANSVNNRQEILAQEQVMDALGVATGQRAQFKTFVQALGTYAAQNASASDCTAFCAGAPGAAIPSTVTPSFLNSIYMTFNDNQAWGTP